MSKRFGRNQRRKMREQLAAAEADARWNESRAGHFMNELYGYQLRVAAMNAQYDALLARYLSGAHLLPPATILMPVTCSKCGAVTEVQP